MFTNYYLTKKGERKIHIGYSDIGWEFSFTTSSNDVNDTNSWISHINRRINQGFYMVDGHGNFITLRALFSTAFKGGDIKKRPHVVNTDCNPSMWRDGIGNMFIEMA